MAEPQPLDPGPVHPCEPGHGLPRAEFRSWLDPDYATLVICKRCGTAAMAASIEAARTLWNETHPERELSEEERAGAHVVADMQEALQGMPRQYLCDEDVHIIQKVTEGEYAGGFTCAQCGMLFRQHAVLQMTAGMRATTTVQ